MRICTIDPKSAAVIGLLLALPFAILNAIVGNRVEPFFSLIRPDSHTSSGEYVLLVGVLFLLLVGAVIAARPMLQKRADGIPTLYVLNGAVAALLFITFVAVSIGLGADIYRCDVLQTPNCD